MPAEKSGVFPFSTATTTTPPSPSSSRTSSTRSLFALLGPALILSGYFFYFVAFATSTPRECARAPVSSFSLFPVAPFLAVAFVDVCALLRSFSLARSVCSFDKHTQAQHRTSPRSRPYRAASQRERIPTENRRVQQAGGQAGRRAGGKAAGM